MLSPPIGGSILFIYLTKSQNMKLLAFLLLFLPAALYGQDSLFTNTEKPTELAKESSLELGMVIKTTKDGKITHFRFYKTTAGDAGTYKLNIWSYAGQRLYTQNYSASGKVGWQRVALTTPFDIKANTNYVVSYFTPNGYYGATNNIFTSARTRGNLSAPASAQVSGNGRYSYVAASSFPTSTFAKCTYYADVVFVAKTAIPLVVSAGKDTVVVVAKDSIRADSIKIHATIQGEGVIFSWDKFDNIDSIEAMIFSATLNPILVHSPPGYNYYVLSAKDQYGNTASDTLIIVVQPNPKDVLFVVRTPEGYFVQCLRDGTTRSQPPEGGPVWQEGGGWTVPNNGKYFFLSVKEE